MCFRVWSLYHRKRLEKISHLNITIARKSFNSYCQDLVEVHNSVRTGLSMNSMDLMLYEQAAPSKLNMHALQSLLSILDTSNLS